MIAMLVAAVLAQEAPGYSAGPFNLIIRWGGTPPVVVRYETKARCEMAALMVVVQGDSMVQQVDGKGTVQPAAKQVHGPNSPWAFCIPG